MRTLRHHPSSYVQKWTSLYVCRFQSPSSDHPFNRPPAVLFPTIAGLRCMPSAKENQRNVQKPKSLDPTNSAPKRTKCSHSKSYLFLSGLVWLAKDLNEGRDGSSTREMWTKLSSFRDVKRDRKNLMWLRIVSGCKEDLRVHDHLLRVNTHGPLHVGPCSSAGRATVI